jgi:hypothetical protein
MKRSILHYCKQDVEGWTKLPFCIFPFPAEEEEYFCSFINERGIQIMCSVGTKDSDEVLHVSFGPIMAKRSGTESQAVSEILDIAFPTIQKFFGDLVFKQADDDPRKPSVKHFIHQLSVFSEN